MAFKKIIIKLNKLRKRFVKTFFHKHTFAHYHSRGYKECIDCKYKEALVNIIKHQR
jgi:hypothetical protein